jgi:hypothetical protein
VKLRRGLNHCLPLRLLAGATWDNKIWNCALNFIKSCLILLLRSELQAHMLRRSLVLCLPFCNDCLSTPLQPAVLACGNQQVSGFLGHLTLSRSLRTLSLRDAVFVVSPKSWNRALSPRRTPAVARPARTLIDFNVGNYKASRGNCRGSAWQGCVT